MLVHVCIRLGFVVYIFLVILPMHIYFESYFLLIYVLSKISCVILGQGAYMLKG